jgi:3-oxoacyl-[acyl-carrier-protein] synthase II
MSHQRRVVITGLGAVTALGLTLDETWQNLLKGTSGIAPITLFDASDLPVRVAGEVKGFDAVNYMDRKQVRRTSRTTHLALAAAHMALKDAGLDPTKIDPYSMGVSLGAGVAGLDKTVDGVMSIADGSTRVNPLGVVSSLANMPAALVAAQFNLQGPNTTTVTACASGVQSIGEAAEMIRRGWVDVMLTGGTDAPILRISILGFNAMGALAQRNDATACRPFDATRDGTILAEGSAVLILEELAHAQQRGAHIYAEVLGHATNLDTNNIVEPDPTGQSAARTMQAAIERSGLRPSDISYIHAHGTATKANDLAETRGIKIIFEEKTPPVSSIKSMLGHTLGAAGSIGVVASAKAITDNWIPPTTNYATPDPDCDLDYVPNVARQMKVNAVLINAFGFGGQNACIVVAKTNLPEVS